MNNTDGNTPIPPAAATIAGKPILTLDVGPVISLSYWYFMAWVALGAGAVCGFAFALVWMLAPDRAWSVWPAGAAVLIGQGVGLLAARPWKKRHLGRWPMAWLMGRGVAILGLFAAGALLYSATRPDPLVFGLVGASGFFVSLLAEVWAYSLQARRWSSHGVSRG